MLGRRSSNDGSRIFASMAYLRGWEVSLGWIEIIWGSQRINSIGRWSTLRLSGASHPRKNGKSSVRSANLHRVSSFGN